MGYKWQLIYRMGIAFFLAIFFNWFYVLFKPLTLYPSYWILNLFTDATLLSNGIVKDQYFLNFVDACIAASAYFLLALLILFTDGITLRNRIYMFLLCSFMILSFNIFRIEILFYILFNYGTNIFHSIHILFWKFLSTLYVFLTWIFLIKVFNVKAIPVYSDYKRILKMFR